jgi:hypothetical protein
MFSWKTGFVRDMGPRTIQERLAWQMSSKTNSDGPVGAVGDLEFGDHGMWMPAGA